MRVYVTQIYIEAGVYYPFSHHFQNFISDELTKRLTPSDAFISKYAEDFNLIFNMSAKAKIPTAEIKGPTVFRKDKDVEYTIFLPFNIHDVQSSEVYRQTLRLLISSISSVLIDLEIDASQLLRDSEDIVERILSNPKTINENWLRQNNE
jgi:hypothetical protein